VLLQATMGTEGAQGLVLHWAGTSNDAPASVYYATSLTPPTTWTLVTNAPAFTNDQWMVALPVGTNTSGYYRLQ
jgi:hypothetical protein